MEIIKVETFLYKSYNMYIGIKLIDYWGEKGLLIRWISVIRDVGYADLPII